MENIVTELREMALELNMTADAISAKLGKLDEVVMRIGEIKSSLMAEIKVERLEAPVQAPTENEKLLEERKEFKKKLEEMKPEKKSKTERTPHKNVEEQLEELKELMAKDVLTKVEKNRLNNMYFRLKKKGIQLPEKKDLRLRSGKYCKSAEQKVQEPKKRGRKQDAFTMADEVAPAPEKGEQLYNCFKQVKTGRWERDGVDLTKEQAEDTIRDLKMEGYKAVMQESEKGYTYKG